MLGEGEGDIPEAEEGDEGEVGTEVVEPETRRENGRKLSVSRRDEDRRRKVTSQKNRGMRKR